MTAELRKLTSPNHSFTWLEVHDKEFQQTKELLTQDMVIKPFHPDRETLLFTDASRLYGMGYALMQVDPKTQERFLVICGSKALTETQKRYATVELECLAILVAVRRCDFYLRGMPSFEVITDHRPLVGVFKNDIFKLDNAYLFWVSVRAFDPQMTKNLSWVLGSTCIRAYPIPHSREASVNSSVSLSGWNGFMTMSWVSSSFVCWNSLSWTSNHVNEWLGLVSFRSSAVICARSGLKFVKVLASPKNDRTLWTFIGLGNRCSARILSGSGPMRNLLRYGLRI